MTIITRFQGTAAVITLNRPQCYNAIDSGTISQIVVFLNEIRENNLVKKIIITSDHPKAFCVGGDIRAAYEALKNADLQHGVMFFEAEYQLVYNLSTYTKPVISLVNGLCFGGGMGLSMHNQFRVITENAILGMPETIIGFFPDVGASYRFSQFPRSFANFYGLTGYNIPLSHALKWNMADYFVPAALLQELLAALCMENGDNHHIIEQFACTASELPIFNEIFIENIFSKTLPKIFDALQNCDNPDSQKLLSDLQARSPLSLAVTAKLIEIGQYLDLKKSLKLDEILAKNFMINPDLKEGIRAQVIDKDRQPQWHYKMADINEEIVRDFFIPTYSDCEVC